MFELQYAKQQQTSGGKPIVTLLTEGNVFAWGSPELKSICEVETKMFADMSRLAGESGWNDVNGPSTDLLQRLAVEMQPLLKVCVFTTTVVSLISMLFLIFAH